MELEKISAFRSELAIAETIEDIKHLETKTSAIAEIARKQKIGKSAQDEVGAFRCDIEAKKGAWLDEFYPSKVNASSTMADAGIEFKESANARLVNKEAELVAEAIEELKQNKTKIVTPAAVAKSVRKKKRDLNIKDKIEEVKNKEINIDFRLGDFEEVFADVPDGSIDCIITDPPYPHQFIECLTKLSRFAKRVLKPH